LLLSKLLTLYQHYLANLRVPKKITKKEEPKKKAIATKKTATPAKQKKAEVKAPAKKLSAAKPEQEKAEVKEEAKKPSANAQPSTPAKTVSPAEQSPSEEDLFGALGKPEEIKEKAEIYDELIAQEMERELIRSQRKQMAGKDAKKEQQKKTQVYTPPAGPILDRVIEIPEAITVKEFSEKTGLGAAKVIGELMKNGVLANINQQIDYDTAQIIADDFGVKIKKKMVQASAEDVFTGNLEALLKDDDPANLQHRPPIVVVMGHVDHGKTSLLDQIRNTSVAAKESGGITQHIGAYQVESNGKKITFLDTPGHEAFTSMRARGAKVTDIAILVVAADEGVKPQTIEAIQHAQDAGVPIIVAINKIDKAGADPARVKGELGEYGLVPEDWGGKTIMTPVSALTGEGIAHLLEMVLLVADMENLKANPNRAAVGTVIEAHLDQSLGPIATVIVNSGTLRIMDNIVIGGTHGRVKVMKDYTGKSVREAGPSMPVRIAGMGVTPQSGDIFQVVADEKTARTQAMKVNTLKEAELNLKRGVGEIISQISSGQMKQLKLVLKADTKGSMEAIKQAIGQIKHEDVGVKIILSGVGGITESDVMMAAAANGIVMGFHTEANAQVKRTSEREGVEVLTYTVIYKLLDDIRKILTGLLEPEVLEVILGRAQVLKIFMTEKKEMIVGCKVISGKIEKVKVRVFRDEVLVGEGNVNSLRKVDQTVNSVEEGNDCGIMYTGFLPLKENDILEAYKMEKRVRTL
jgi:translation initiation factor IF-2